MPTTFSTSSVDNPNGGGERAPGIESQAGTSIRAHQGQRTAAGRKHRPGRGDRGTDREQGARPLRRGKVCQQIVHARHVVVTSRRPALASWRWRPDQGPALCRGQPARREGPFEDDQGAACPCRRPLIRGGSGHRTVRPHQAQLSGRSPSAEARSSSAAWRILPCWCPVACSSASAACSRVSRELSVPGMAARISSSLR